MRASALLTAALLVVAIACRQEMYDQPRYEPLEPSDFFDDLRSARPEVPGTVPQGRVQADEHLYLGRIDGEPAGDFPFPITRPVLERGRERYDVFCAPCHDRLGYGRGMIVLRGFPEPPSFHTPELRERPPGHYYIVISDGSGDMYSYADRIAPRDRWAVVAYIRALQLSQFASLEDVPEDARSRLEQER